MTKNSIRFFAASGAYSLPARHILYGKPDKEAEKMSKQEAKYTVIRLYGGTRTAEELVADLIKAHECRA